MRSVHVVILIAVAVSTYGAWLLHHHVGIQARTGAPVTCDPDVDWSGEFRQTPTGMTLIAHAGGGTPWGSRSNSLQALDWHYANGTRVFELDFSFTRDGELVGLHNWADNFYFWYGYDSLPWTHRLFPFLVRMRSIDHATFMRLQMRCGLAQLDLAGLRAWLQDKPDAVVVTDVKGDNLQGLALIASAFGPARTQFVAQIYEPSEAVHARELGFGGVALTVYRLDHSFVDLPGLVEGVGLTAVVLHHGDVRDPGNARYLQRIRDQGVPIWVFVVNQPRALAEVEALGADAAMSDRLVR